MSRLLNRFRDRDHKGILVLFVTRGLRFKLQFMVLVRHLQFSTKPYRPKLDRRWSTSRRYRPRLGCLGKKCGYRNGGAGCWGLRSMTAGFRIQGLRVYQVSGFRVRKLRELLEVFIFGNRVAADGFGTGFTRTRMQHCCLASVHFPCWRC